MTQAQDIAKSQKLAGMPESVSSAAVQLLDSMVCVGEGEPPWLKDRNMSSPSMIGGGSSLQGPIQTKLTNAFYLEVCAQTCVCICLCVLYMHGCGCRMHFVERTKPTE